ncbi:MAG TPA: helix-turn-helix transcriptional regulator [Terriglobales bacterium]|nr:helix-turn-helix transcriptional regulator [Terriglobales bacterium]
MKMNLTATFDYNSSQSESEHLGKSSRWVLIGPGNRLRMVREQLGFTLRDVEMSSQRLAEKYKNEEFIIPLSRLSDIETKGHVPSLFRLYTLAVLYRVDVEELLGWYGIDLDQIQADQKFSEPRRTHRVEPPKALNTIEIPVKLDPGLDLRKTGNLGRMIEQWGTVPIAKLQALSNGDFTYGYIGTEDFMMYPLLMPGSFIQVDESRNVVADGVWRSEYERPIYFVETRDGYFCCWCSVKGEVIILQPHPLSPSSVRLMRFPQEAEVIGQVVGFAMRLDRFSPPTKLPETKAQSKLNSGAG